MLTHLFNVFIDNTPFWLYIIHQAYEIQSRDKVRSLIAVSTLIFTNEFAIGYIYIYVMDICDIYIYVIYIGYIHIYIYDIYM